MTVDRGRRRTLAGLAAVVVTPTLAAAEAFLPGPAP